MTDPKTVEAVARAIYDEMPYDELTGSKPAWVFQGNSLKQDEARRMAQAAITAHLSALEAEGMMVVRRWAK